MTYPLFVKTAEDQQLYDVAREGGWSEWVRNPSDLNAIRNGCYFDHEAGQYVVDFFTNFLWLDRDTPFVPAPFQEDVLRRLFGWKRPDGTRRFRHALLFWPKKSSKSPLSAGLSLYMLVADQEPKPEVYNAAVDSKQAEIVFNYVAAMVRNSPELRKLLRVIPTTKRIIPERGSPLCDGRFMRALSSDGDNSDGLQSNCQIIDELHLFKNRRLWDALKYAGIARKQPLQVIITTAGEDLDSLCYEQYSYAKKVEQDLEHDTSYFVSIYEAGPKDPLDSEETWRKANPALGYWLSIEDFRKDYTASKAAGPAEFRNFCRRRLNIWVKDKVKHWLPMDKWQACAGSLTHEQMEQELEGQPCWAGVDLSSTQDMTAVSLVFPRREGEHLHYDILSYFWVPEATAANKPTYQNWSDQGWLTLTEGDNIDWRLIWRRIRELSERYLIQQVAADPTFALQLGSELTGEGIDFYLFRQGARVMTPAVKEFEAAVFGGRIRHGGHPVLRWMASNATLDESPDGVKVSRERVKHQKIDGIVTAIMGVGGAMSNFQKSGGFDFEPFTVG